MAETNRVDVRVSRRFAAAAERVFDAWLDVDQMSRWLFATPSGVMVHAEVDPRVGGRFLFTERRDGVDVEHHGLYVEIDRPRRLAFDFTVPIASDEPTRVIIEVRPDGEGCELTLTHQGVLAEYAERTQGGWTMILANQAAGMAA
jgi:uncharacterized protein YndB with AHSA1/START domain